MGAYLSSPVTDKKSDDFEESEKFTCGLSGMQGWRISMEDAYNCAPQMDNDTGFFAVYDGHGGGEVAIYCSHHFVDMLKDTDSYKEGRIEEALKSTFMEIDKKLRDPFVIKELKLLSQKEPGDPPVTKEDIEKLEEQERQEKEEVEDETKLLYEEATMSIEELLAKYGRVVNETEQKFKAEMIKEDTPSAESSRSQDGSDTEVAETDKSEDLQDEVKEESLSKAVGDSEKARQEKSTKIETTSNVNEAGGEGPPLKKKLQKEFLKVKPTKKVGDVEDSDDDDDDDYEGFESDEAVEGSSSDDDDDDVDDDASDDTEEVEDGQEATSEGWADEKDPMLNEAGGRAGVEEPGVDSGTTAVVAVLRDIELFVANAGDSRCVLSRKGGVAYDMSEDHKPEDEKELQRITTAGGHVNAQGRVNGGLNLSRAIGDHLYKTNSELPLEKQMISAFPDVRHVTLEPEDEFLVIACDGIWNVLSSQEVVDFVRARLYPNNENSSANANNDNKTPEVPKVSSVCEELFSRCLAPDTGGDGTGCDNMTCVIVKFKQEWLARRHTAKKEEKTTSCLSENSGNPIREKSINNDVNELAKPKVVESNNVILEPNKRSLATSEESQSRVNGNNGPVKRAKLE